MNTGKLLQSLFVKNPGISMDRVVDGHSCNLEKAYYKVQFGVEKAKVKIGGLAYTSETGQSVALKVHLSY